MLTFTQINNPLVAELEELLTEIESRSDLGEFRYPTVQALLVMLRSIQENPSLFIALPGTWTHLLVESKTDAKSQNAKIEHK